jgi:hypothetical protein
MSTAIRSARPDDLPLICAFIRELAEYEKLADAVRFDEDVLHGYLFGPRPMAEVLIGEVDGDAKALRCFSIISRPSRGGRVSIWKISMCARRRAGPGWARRC